MCSSVLCAAYSVHMTCGPRPACEDYDIDANRWTREQFVTNDSLLHTQNSIIIQEVTFRKSNVISAIGLTFRGTEGRMPKCFTHLYLVEGLMLHYHKIYNP